MIACTQKQSIYIFVYDTYWHTADMVFYPFYIQGVQILATLVCLGTCYHLYCHISNSVKMQLEESRLLRDLPGLHQETLLPMCLKSITAQQQLPSGTWRGSETPMWAMAHHFILGYCIRLTAPSEPEGSNSLTITIQ